MYYLSSDIMCIAGRIAHLVGLILYFGGIKTILQKVFLELAELFVEQFNRLSRLVCFLARLSSLSVNLQEQY